MNCPGSARSIRERGQLFLPLVGIIYFLVEGATPIKAALYGIIVGTVTLSGLGLKMANGLVELAHGQLLPTLFFTMISSLILGMGAPTTANYVITSTIAGAGIARANPLKTGVNATKLAIAAFLIPYFFVYAPSLLLINTSLAETVRVIAGALIGMVGVGAAVEGWLLTGASAPERILLLAGGLMLIDPGLYTDLAGLPPLSLPIFNRTFSIVRPFRSVQLIENKLSIGRSGIADSNRPGGLKNLTRGEESAKVETRTGPGGYLVVCNFGSSGRGGDGDTSFLAGAGAGPDGVGRLSVGSD